MRINALGMEVLVFVQLEEVTWKFSNTHVRMDVAGIGALAGMQLKEVTLTC